MIKATELIMNTCKDCKYYLAYKKIKYQVIDLSKINNLIIVEHHGDCIKKTLYRIYEDGTIEAFNKMMHDSDTCEMFKKGSFFDIELTTEYE